nr:hypothetical protein CPGR_00234 [Mycolicibacter nonchromogenicus]
MISRHFFRSSAKLVLWVRSRTSRARLDRQTMAQPGSALQSFCGAVTSTSTPRDDMSAQTTPAAMQSKTNSPPTAAVAVPMRVR